jgi:outer membrane receptor protein involved in Fe transport
MKYTRVGRKTLMLSAGLALTLSAESFAATDEIVVTARKREENLQEIPIAIEVFTVEEIEKLNINSLDDITLRSSSIILDNGFAPQDTRIAIRGLSPIRGRQNVAVLQDGVDLTSEAIATAGGSLLLNPRLFDIERVEIVKGPQNALYGRSAFAGAINYITRKPTNDLAITAGLDVGNFGRLDLRGGLSGAIIDDKLLAGINVASWQHDGYYKSQFTGENQGGESGKAVAGTLVWNATEKLSFNLRGEYTDDKFDTPAYFGLKPSTAIPIPTDALGTVLPPSVTSINGVVGRIPSVGTVLGGSAVSGGVVGPTASENPGTVSAAFPNGADYPGTDRETWRVTLTADWEFDNFDVIYLGQLGSQDSTQFIDVQRIGSITQEALSYAAEALFTEENDLISQELRFQSNGDGPFQWTVGGLFWQQDQDFRDAGVNCVANPIAAGPFNFPGGDCAGALAALGNSVNSPARFADTWTREVDHLSAYFLVSYEFLENWEVIAEGRYTDEDLEITGPERTVGRIIDPRNLGFPGTFPADLSPALSQLQGTESDSFFTPKVSLQWTPTEDSLLYASFAQGRKPAGIRALSGGAGGFNIDDQRFEQERVDVYELGAKTSWLDNRLTINGAAFFQDFTDKQASVQVVAGDQLVTRPVNAGSAEVWGLELDVNALLTDYLTMSLSYTYLDTEYKDFVANSTGASQIAAAGNCEVVTVVGRGTCRLDFSGNSLEYAPDNAFVGGLSYSRPVEEGVNVLIEGDLIYQDERFLDQTNTITFAPYTLVNLRAGFTSDSWDVIAYVDNVFENDEVRTGFASPFTGPGSEFVFGPPNAFIFQSGFVGILPDLRQVGVRVNYRFGG